MTANIARVGEHYTLVRERIAQAALASGRQPHDIVLVAVSKYACDDDVQALRGMGVVDFGEARVDSLQQRSSRVHPRARWHMIGRLQTNKVAKVVGTAAIIHSVDSVHLAHAIGEASHKLGHVQRAFVQVNVDNDPNKAGVPVEEVVPVLGAIRRIRGISIQGLSTIPMLGGDSSATFARLRDVRDSVQRQWPEIVHLSMGMSQDFELAIAQGATHVRVGTMIFGSTSTATA